ncbi:MAG: chorismate mutase [Planctomycetes bacterium]|nr:chorismate mutase [Planctomycetota bacterium]
MEEIEALRHAIDGVDDRLLALLTERQKLASRLGEVKRSMGIPIYDQAREMEILDRLRAHNDGTLAEEAVMAAWREIFSASRQAQNPLRVAYLGPEGTFTQQAALYKFGTSADLIATHTISGAFSWIAKRTVDYAVLPVENTLQGIVGETVDLLGAARIPLIIGEIAMPIHFVFSATIDNLEDIRTIYSKGEAFLQCSEFLNQPALEKAVRTPVSSTAEAVWRAAEDATGGALSAEIAATQAGVPILFRHVENDARNKTRFLILGHEQPPPGGNDKTSVFAKVPNVSGGLETLLSSFREHGVNLTKIESRPMDDAVNFETWFYIEFEGHIGDIGDKDLIEKHDLVWLGSYPRYDTTTER